MTFFWRKRATNGKGTSDSVPVDKQFTLVEDASASEFAVSASSNGKSIPVANGAPVNTVAPRENNASQTNGSAHGASSAPPSVALPRNTNAPAPDANASPAQDLPPESQTVPNAESPTATPSVGVPAAQSRLSPQLVDAAIRLVDGNSNSQPVISVRGLKKIYQMGDVEVAALQGVDIDIYPGEVTAIMGPSGSGKSTLMNIIGCLDVPTEGSYLLDGTDVSKLNDDELAAIRCKKIGFVFQSFNLLSRTTALANVELPLIYAGVGGGERHRRAKSALTLVGLGQRMDHKPNELSGGQQQRVAIARALINEPAMILADEPTGNLDSKTSVEIMELFQRLNVEQGISIVFVTHNNETADYCHRTIRVRDGLVEVDRRHRPVAGIYSDPAIQTRLATLPNPYVTGSAEKAAERVAEAVR